MDGNTLTQLVSPAWQLYEGEVPIATFIPTVLALVKVVGSDGESESVRVGLHFGDGTSTEALIPISNLDTVDWFGVDHRCLLNSGCRWAKRHIAVIIRAGVSKAPVERQYLLDRTGVRHIGNAVLFVAGDRVITQSSALKADTDYELAQLPFRLDIDESISPVEAFDGMMRLIGLSPEIGPVLVAHTVSGIIRAAFKEAGMTPCAVLVIVGKSGMLKSNYIPHLVQLYNRADGIGPATRFNSTKRFIEDALYEYSECTAVIDELRTAKAQQEQYKAMLGEEYRDYDLVIAQINGRPYEQRIIDKMFYKLIEENSLRPVVFHSLRHSSTSLKLKLSKGNIKAVQGDTGHAEARMVTDTYAHGFDADRKLIAQEMDSGFFSRVGTDQKAAEADSATVDLLKQLVRQHPELLTELLKEANGEQK